MRAWIVVVGIAVYGIATAQPGQPPPSSNAGLDKLDADLRVHEASRDKAAQEKTLRTALDEQRKLSGDDSVYVWRREVALMSFLQTSDKPLAALDVIKPMLARAERKHGKVSREVLESLGHMIATYEIARMFSTGELDPLYQRYIAVSKQLHGETDRMYAHDLARYASYLSVRGEIVAARRAYEQALKIQDAIKEDPSGTLMSLGLLYMQTDQSKAKTAFDRYLAIRQKGATATEQVHTLWWVSGLYRRGGRLELATPLETKALDMARKEIARLERAPAKPSSFPGEQSDLERAMFSLGGMLLEIDDLAGAEPVITKYVALVEKLGGYLATPYGQLMQLRRKQGRNKEALAALEKVQKIAGGPGMYPIMGDIYRELGNTKKAEELYIKAQADLDKLFGKRAMLVLRLHYGLFAIYIAAKNLAKAERVLTEHLEIAERELAFVLATGTETDHLAYFVREAHLLDTVLGYHARVAPKRASAATLALTTLLRRKGRILDAAAASLGKLRTRLPADDQKLLLELEQARAQLAKVAVAGSASNPVFAKQVAALEEQIQKLEVALARKNAELKLAIEPVELAAVQKKLPKGARLVEIVNYQPGDITAAFAAKKQPEPRRYLAYVLADRGAPTLVDLGEAAAIDEGISKLRVALADPDNTEAAVLAKTLHELTFAKLVPALGKSTQVMIAPDGALNVLPFAALHDGKRFLVETYTFTYLTSGRDLLRLGTRTTTKGTPKAYVFADPDFDGPPSPTTPTPATPATRRSRAMQNLYWPRLPGTAAEADALEKSLTSPTVYRGKHATETRLKALQAPAILHLATHGFFLADADASVENPLLRSGLVFAGANALSSGNDDGVVTALEAAGLDLRGTRLVVMSACETGVGKITNGHGVYGLRRALVIAGAESLVMSMWQVDDLATKELMAGYYQKLEAGQGRSEALRTVQRELLAKPRYAHPYFWASFIAAGDSAPFGR
jgi:CHAT domain-containing protein